MISKQSIMYILILLEFYLYYRARFFYYIKKIVCYLLTTYTYLQFVHFFYICICILFIYI